MPGPRTQQILNEMTVSEYLDAQWGYRNYNPLANLMSMEEYMEKLEFDDALHAHGHDDMFDQRANFAANFSGHPPRARDHRDYHTSESSHNRSDRRSVGRDGYEGSLANESADGRYGHPGARSHSGAANPYRSRHGDIGNSTDISAHFEGTNHRHGVPPSAPRDGRSLEGGSTAHSLLNYTSSRHCGSRQDLHSQHRDDNYNSDGGSTVRHGGSVVQEGRRNTRRSPAGDRHRPGS